MNKNGDAAKDIGYVVDEPISGRELDNRLQRKSWKYDPPKFDVTYINPDKTLDPEKNLMRVMLLDSLNSFKKYLEVRYGIAEKKYTNQGERKIKREYEEAKEWIFSQGNKWVFDFESICETLKQEPSYYRRKLLEWTKEAIRYRKKIASGMGND
jgi:hypothetical protein